MMSTGQADRHHLFDAVLEKVSRVAGHLTTAGSADFHILTNVLLLMETWTSQTPSLLCAMICIKCQNALRPADVAM